MTRTEGQRLLRQRLAIKAITQRALARMVKRSEPTVSLWLSGENTPDGDSRIAVEDALGIPVRAWARAPRKNGGT